MSGVEWTIVTIVGVCLILLFIILEVVFPPPDTSDYTIVDGNTRDHQPVVRSAGSHTLQ